jgi:ribosomal protein S18 acetylase RimI-like enzyme
MLPFDRSVALCVVSSATMAAAPSASDSGVGELFRLFPPVSVAGSPQPSFKSRQCCCAACIIFRMERFGTLRTPALEASDSSCDDLPYLHFDEAPSAQRSLSESGYDVALPDTCPLISSVSSRQRNRLLLTQLRAVHTHCFPVPYDDDFFEGTFMNPAHINLVLLARDTSEEYEPFLPPSEGGAMMTAAGFDVEEVCRRQALADSDPRPVYQDLTMTDACRQIIAFATIRVRQLPAPLRTRDASFTGKEGYIATLGVRREARKRRLAQEVAVAMLQEAFTASKCDRVWLHCLVGNHAAHELYRRYGFSVCDFLPLFYRIHRIECDAHVLALCNPKHTRPELIAALQDADTFVRDPDQDDAPLTIYADSDAASHEAAAVLAVGVGVVLLSLLTALWLNPKRIL